MNRALRALAVLMLGCCVGHLVAATPQSTVFTYQGNLSADGPPANGLFDLGFTLFDAAIGGNAIGTAITMPRFPVVNGKVITDLDFPTAFAGQQRWLEVTVNGQVLTPRQSVDTVPVAQYALTARSLAGASTVEVHGTGQLQVSTATTTYTLIPGLSATVDTPADAVVRVHTDGGVQSTGAAATTYSVLDIGLFVDGVLSSQGGQRRLSIANTSALGQLIANWSMERTYTLTPGNHVFQVKAVSGAPGSATANVSSASAPQLQGVLIVSVTAATP